MPFDLVAALLAGLVATIVMTAMMAGAGKAGMTQMPAMTLITGAMLSGDRQKANQLGAVAHFIMMGTVVFGIAYAALFAALGTASWVAGIVIGVVHGVVVGLVGMPMMGSIHPRMTAGALPDGGTVTESDGEVRLVAPGLFGKNWGGMTPAGMVMGHAVYGLVLALVYAAVV